MKPARIIFAAALAVLFSNGHAQANGHNFYVAGQFGSTRLTDKSLNDTASGDTAKIVSDAGYTASIAAGYALPYNLRAEAEATLASGLDGSLYDPAGSSTGVRWSF